MVYNYDWSSSYAGAVLENDQQKVSKRILQAELAILRRTREPGLARREWQAMEVAMNILHDLRVSRHKNGSPALVPRMRGKWSSEIG
jgi:hypothetical protein